MTPEEQAHRQKMIDHAKGKYCGACNATGKYFDAMTNTEEECPYCEDGWIKPEEECEHRYAERTTAPLGVTCIKCGHFVGAWE